MATYLVDGSTPLPESGDTGWGTVLNTAILAVDDRFTYSSGTSTFSLASDVVGSSLTSVGTLTSLSVTGDITVGGNVTINGTSTTVNSTTITVDDPIFTLGGDSAPASDDNKDRGIEFRWHNGSAAKVGFFGFDDSTGKFTFIPDATNTSEVFSGTKGAIDVDSLESVTLYVDSIEIDTTGATSSQVLQFNGTKFAPATLTYSQSFATVAVSGQSDVVADSESDTLTLAAGSGVTITTDNSTDTVTVTNSGVTQVSGTTNQVTASASTGSITLSLPQDIHTGASPTFAAMSVTDGSGTPKSALEDLDSTTTTSTSATVLKSVSASTYSSVKYIIHATDGTNYVATEILAAHDGSSASKTEYGTVTIGSSVATFTVDIDSGNVRLLATPASATSTTFRVRSTAIEA